MVLEALPDTLETDVLTVRSAVEATINVLEQEDADREAAWRAAFKPTAYLLGTERRPSQGPERWLRISVDLTQPPVTFASQALAAVDKTPVVSPLAAWSLPNQASTAYKCRASEDYPGFIDA
ncbi:MAG: hypothetical protein ACR652_02655 [Methylocystis sp.]|uniref:hypothetical protein n=1 Tax=Methylocystis sp. TaxID=1911079 RepID=UPI003DA545D4